MRVPNLETLIQEVEQRLSKKVYGLNSDYLGHRDKVIRMIMVYERAQHLLATQSYQVKHCDNYPYLSYGEVAYLAKEASRLAGGGHPIERYMTQEYGAPTIIKGKPVYGIAGLNIAIDKIRFSLQAYLLELDTQDV